ncbi:uncharacterized protein PFL1_05703 [Pseudozyma flocculosa PF-1]|uniref:Uncharacterized protein n=2 Tax=Pseudozyma flocculosa TaxID=84751 RepID=A0A5C3F919_9BASI|nr:uncharacterized protein PFL1_05703 [Pseudozyma flocculosa PF-1]EPQ26724.1 hypothetical protein PFL1_05703 [Pseudozyma flocculosa PF-1]SPO40954.1 uncharacterized protein PSFLO_06436 [Pseudozyma flocculosa]
MSSSTRSLTMLVMVSLGLFAASSHAAFLRPIQPRSPVASSHDVGEAQGGIDLMIRSEDQYFEEGEDSPYVYANNDGSRCVFNPPHPDLVDGVFGQVCDRCWGYECDCQTVSASDFHRRCFEVDPQAHFFPPDTSGEASQSPSSPQQKTDGEEPNLARRDPAPANQYLSYDQWVLKNGATKDTQRCVIDDADFSLSNTDLAKMCGPCNDTICECSAGFDDFCSACTKYGGQCNAVDQDAPIHPAPAGGAAENDAEELKGQEEPRS